MKFILSIKVIIFMHTMRHLKAVLIDINGTLHVGNELIGGSANALKKLRDTNLFKIKFVTNTTKESKSHLHGLLKSVGLDIDKKEIFSSLTAARQLIEKHSLRPLLFLEPEAYEDFENVDTTDPNAVVVGLAPNKFDYEHLNEAFNLLLNGARLIGIHKGKYYKRKDGLALGPGAFISALEFSSDVKAEIVGKPTKEFFLSSIEELNAKPDECLMIGDAWDDDVQGALNAGMHGILVKTGKYRQNDENKIDNPTYVAENFADAVDFIVQNFTNN